MHLSQHWRIYGKHCLKWMPDVWVITGGCLSYYSVTGVWFSGENTNPTIGSPGEWSREPEIKIEVNVEDSRVEKTVAAVRKVHPYEEPLINFIRLE